MPSIWGLFNDNTKRAKEGNEEQLKHIGIASTLEERQEILEKMKETKKTSSEWKKRTRDERSQFVYQAGDSTGCKVVHKVLKYFWILSDTIALGRNKK